MFLVHRDHHHHSIHAGWLGRFRRRIPGHDRKSGLPHEGSGSFDCVRLFVAPGRDSIFAHQDGAFQFKGHSSARYKSDRSSCGLLVLC